MSDAGKKTNQNFSIFDSSSPLYCLFILLFLFATPIQLRAFEVGPLVNELASTGRDASAAVSIKNTSDVPLPVEIAISELLYNPDGVYETQSADSDFLVFPPTAIIPPGATQVVRLQWLGDPALQTSRSFFANIAQIPVDLPEGDGSDIQLVFAFNVFVHVAPEKGAPKLELSSVELSKDQSGNPLLIAKIANNGNIYSYVNRTKISVRSGENAREFTAREFNELKIDTLLPPNVTKTLEIPLGAGGWSEPIDVSLNLLDTNR